MIQKCYAILDHPNMHPQAKFGIPTLNNIRDMKMLLTDIQTDVIEQTFSLSNRPLSGWGLITL